MSESNYRVLFKGSYRKETEVAPGSSVQGCKVPSKWKPVSCAMRFTVLLVANQLEMVVTWTLKFSACHVVWICLTFCKIQWQRKCLQTGVVLPADTLFPVTTRHLFVERPLYRVLSGDPPLLSPLQATHPRAVPSGDITTSPPTRPV